MVKIYLAIGNTKVDISDQSCIDVSDMVKNIKDVIVSYDRVNLGGVIRKCGSEIQFVGIARSRLIGEYMTCYYNAKAAIAVFEMDNNWNFNETWQCPLDFSTFKYDTYTASISCLDNSAAAILKAKKSTKYEMPVSDIKDSYQVYMDSVLNKNTASYKLSGTSVEGQDYMSDTLARLDLYYFLPFYSQGDGDITVNNSFVLTDQAESQHDENSTLENLSKSYFVECIKDCAIDIDLSNLEIWNVTYRHYIALLKFRTTDTMDARTVVFGKDLSTTAHTKLTEFQGKIQMKEGERLQLCIVSYYHNFQEETIYMGNGLATLTWNDRSAAIDIDCIKPISLLDRMLRLMSEGQKVYMQGSISSTINGTTNDRLVGSVLMASESIRNFTKAKAYSSFSNFCDFMQYEFGYIYDITEGEYVRPSRSAAAFNYFYEIMADINTYNIDVSTVYSGTDYDVIGYYDMFFARVGKTLYIYWKENDRYYGNEAFNIYNVDVPGTLDTSKTYTTTLSRVSGFVEIAILDSSLAQVYHMTGRAIGDVIYSSYTDSLTYQSDGRSIDRLFYSSLDPVCFSGVQNFAGIDTSSMILNTTISAPDGYSVLFSTVYHKFVAKSGSTYYDMFDTAYNYNLNGYPRMDLYFNLSTSTDANKKYIGNSKILINIEESAYSAPVTFEYGATITFKHYSEVYSDKVIKTLDQISGLEYSVSTGRLYSQLDIGYEKQDYDSKNNGGDEFNFDYTYSTGNVLKDNINEMISPYRADCYGISELVAKRDEETSSTDSDNDMFAVSIKTGEGVYDIDRETSISGSYSDTVFNAKLAPFYMIEANKSMIGCSCDRLEFASSTGNSSIMIDGHSVSEDVDIPERLMTAGDIELVTDDREIPDSWNGLIQFDWDGYRYQCYLSSIDIDLYKAFRYKLIEKSRTSIESQ